MIEEYISDKESLESSYITLRTMASDLEALRKSGGDVSRMSKYAIPIQIQTSQPKETSPQLDKKQEIPKNQIINSQIEANKINFKKLSPIIKIISIILIISLFFAFGYFVLPKILPQKVTKTIEPQITTTTPQFIR